MRSINPQLAGYKTSYSPGVTCHFRRKCILHWQGLSFYDVKNLSGLIYKQKSFSHYLLQTKTIKTLISRHPIVQLIFLRYEKINATYI